jgi:hypothetical protein
VYKKIALPKFKPVEVTPEKKVGGGPRLAGRSGAWG